MIANNSAISHMGMGVRDWAAQIPSLSADCELLAVRRFSLFIILRQAEILERWLFDKSELRPRHSTFRLQAGLAVEFICPSAKELGQVVGDNTRRRCPARLVFVMKGNVIVGFGTVNSITS